MVISTNKKGRDIVIIVVSKRWHSDLIWTMVDHSIEI